MGKWLSPVWGSMVSKQELGPTDQKGSLPPQANASFSFPQLLPLGQFRLQDLPWVLCVSYPFQVFIGGISHPTAMTSCDPLGTQTLCGGSGIRWSASSSTPARSRGGSRPCTPLPWEWNAHRGSSSSGRKAAPPAQHAWGRGGGRP